MNVTTGVVTFKVAPDYESATIYTFVATETDENDKNTTQELMTTTSDIDELTPPNTPTSEFCKNSNGNSRESTSGDPYDG